MCLCVKEKDVQMEAAGVSGISTDDALESHTKSSLYTPITILKIHCTPMITHTHIEIPIRNY